MIAKSASQSLDMLDSPELDSPEVARPRGVVVLIPTVVLPVAILLASAALAESRLIDESGVSADARKLSVGVSAEEGGWGTPLDGILIFGCRGGLFVQVELISRGLGWQTGARTSVTLLIDDQPETELKWLRRDDVAFSFDGDQWLDRLRSARQLTAKLVDGKTWNFDLKAARQDLRRFERRCGDWGTQSEKAEGDMSPELVLARTLARPSNADLPRVMHGRNQFSFRVLLTGAASMTSFCKSLGESEGEGEEEGLLYAASIGDMEGVHREVTARETSGARSDDEKWRTQVKLAQAAAACRGHVEIVRFFGAAKADPLGLLGAVHEGHTEVVDALLAAGTDANYDLRGVSLLQIAALRSHAEVVRALLAAGADASAEYKGETALNMAVRRSDLVLTGASHLDPGHGAGGGLTALAEIIEMLRAAMAGGD